MQERRRQSAQAVEDEERSKKWEAEFERRQEQLRREAQEELKVGHTDHDIC